MIHQGLGTLLSLLDSGHVLTRHSARRLSALPGSNLPLSLAALSSPPRPSDQVIHPKRSNMRHDSTDPIGTIADLVQDLYLRELKSYKFPEVKASDADAHVQKFTVPKAPASPEETDIANELKSYETQAVDVEGAQGEDDAVLPQEDWFEEEDESITTPGATH
jgi:F-type H+-transporting ATPase subunit h